MINLKQIKNIFKCVNCIFSCEENTYSGNTYYYDKECCPKDFPLTIWLRQNADWKIKRIKE